MWDSISGLNAFVPLQGTETGQRLGVARNSLIAGKQVSPVDLQVRLLPHITLT